MSRNTAIRIPTAPAAPVISLSRCAAAVQRRERCWNKRPPQVWHVPVSEVHADQPRGDAPSQRAKARLRSAGAAMPPSLPVPSRESLRLKSPCRVPLHRTGQTPLVDGRDIVTGKRTVRHRRAADGMVFAVIERSPVVGAKIVRFDATAAAKCPA